MKEGIITLTVRESDANQWLSALLETEKENGKFPEDSVSGRLKNSLLCGLAKCDCGKASDG